MNFSNDFTFLASNQINLVNVSGVNVSNLGNISATTFASKDLISYVGSQPYYAKKIIFEKLFGGGVYSSALTTIIVSAAGASAIPGQYQGSRFGLPPIVRSGTLLSAGGMIYSHYVLGCNLGETSGSQAVFREYWNGLQVNSFTLLASHFPTLPTSSNQLPVELITTYAYGGLGQPLSACQLRCHNFLISSINGTPGISMTKETITTVDLTVDQYIQTQVQVTPRTASNAFYYDYVQYTL